MTKPNIIENYPGHWWQPIIDENKPDWEILPQEAGIDEVILSKRNELGLLSNFSHTPFEFHGKTYNSVEGFWQMMFYPESASDPRAGFPGINWAVTREQVSQMESHEAFAYGATGFRNMQAMGINSVTFEGRSYEYWTDKKNAHYDLIVEAMWCKLRQNENVRNVLLATGDLILRADHIEHIDAPPSWRYYEIWMEIRRALQLEISTSSTTGK